MNFTSWFYRSGALLLLAVLSGCASIPDDRGLADVQAQLNTRGGPQLPSVSGGSSGELVTELLNHAPLTRDDAVRVALLANPKLRASYAKLGLSGAEVYEAGRLSNPTLSASVLFTSASGDANQYTLGIAQSFADLLLLPTRSRLAKADFERTKVAVAGELIDFAAEVEAAYYRLVGAQQIERMRDAVANAAEASAQLAQRFFAAGNISRLELELNQAEASQARVDALAARNDVAVARAELSKRIGLPADRKQWQVMERLPLPVANEDDPAVLQTLADDNRLDLDAARRELALLEDAYGVSRKSSLLEGAEIGVEAERDTDGSHLAGPNIAVQLPLFHQGQASVLRARAQLEQSRAELDALRVDISNAVQLAQTQVANARELAEHYRQTAVPLHEQIVAHTQLEVNYMLSGVFELVRAKQQEYDTYQNYLQAVRDYWLARVELARAVGTRLPSDAQIQQSSPEPQASETDQQQTSDSPPASNSGSAPADHSHHH